MFWIAQVVIVSFVIIFLLHNLYYFFKETLTIPKMKDMVKRPQQKYDALFRELEESKNANAMHATNDENDAASMKNELKRYMMELNAPQPPQQPEPQQLHSNFIEVGSTYQ
jgi:hypothetical protein